MEKFIRNFYLIIFTIKGMLGGTKKFKVTFKVSNMVIQ